MKCILTLIGQSQTEGKLWSSYWWINVKKSNRLARPEQITIADSWSAIWSVQETEEIILC